MRRLRLLPFVIFATGLMLTVKLGDIWQIVSGEAIQVAKTQAKTAEAKPAEAKPAMAQQAPTSLTPQGKAEGKADGKAPAATQTAAKPEAGSKEALKAAGGSRSGQAPLNPNTGDPIAFTAEEVELLQKLAEKREEMEARIKELDVREAVVKAAESRIGNKIAEMKALQKTIEDLLRKYDDQEDNKIKSLVKIYETMKPADAARIFEQLDMAILLQVIERMKEAKSAPVLAAMDPIKAKVVTAELAQRRQLPATATVQ